MKFEEALRNFDREIQMEYGIEGAVVKMAIQPDLMAKVVYEQATQNLMKFSSEKMGEFHLCNVQLVARRREDF